MKNAQEIGAGVGIQIKTGNKESTVLEYGYFWLIILKLGTHYTTFTVLIDLEKTRNSHCHNGYSRFLYYS